MAFPLTDAQKAAFMGNHDMTTRAVVLRGSQSLGEIPLRDLNVYATYGTRGGRDGGIMVDQGVIDSGLLNPLSDQVILYTGIRDYVEVPIFTGRVDTRNSEDASSVDVPLLSRGGE